MPASLGTSLTAELAVAVCKMGTVVLTCAKSPKVAGKIVGKVAMRYYY